MPSSTSREKEPRGNQMPSREIPRSHRSPCHVLPHHHQPGSHCHDPESLARPWLRYPTRGDPHCWGWEARSGSSSHSVFLWLNSPFPEKDTFFLAKGPSSTHDATPCIQGWHTWLPSSDTLPAPCPPIIPPYLCFVPTLLAPLTYIWGASCPPPWCCQRTRSQRAAPVLGKPPGKKSHNFCSIYSCGGCRLR